MLRLTTACCLTLAACMGRLDGRISDPAPDGSGTEVAPATAPPSCDPHACDDGDPCSADACASGVGCTHRAVAGWVVETVDAYGESGSYASLAIDGGGAFYVAYHSESRAAVMLARRAPGGAWALEVVDPEIGYHPFTSVVLADGVPGVVYSSAARNELRYATPGASGAWVVETVAETAGIWTKPAAVVDALGALHMMDAKSFGPARHLVRSPTGQLAEYSVGAAYWVWDGNLAASPTGQVHAAFVEATSIPEPQVSTVWHASFEAGGGWTQDVALELPFATVVPSRLAVAVDPDGQPHVLHLDDLGGRVLRHLTPAEGEPAWTASVIDGDGVGGAFSVRHDGTLMAAYDHLVAQELRFAWRRDDGTYAIELVDAHDGFTDGSAFGAVSLVLDPAGRPHIAYWATHPSDLRLASRCTAVTP